MSDRKKIPDRDLKLLFGHAAMRCAMPSCRKELYILGSDGKAGALIAKVAHIAAYSKNGPRSDASMKEADVNRYPNLILLCANHHDEVDQLTCDYTIEKLKNIKNEHEAWVKASLADAAADVAFHELELVTDAIQTSTVLEIPDFKQIGRAHV